MEGAISRVKSGPLARAWTQPWKRKNGWMLSSGKEMKIERD
jgi:hypothetical protein